MIDSLTAACGAIGRAGRNAGTCRCRPGPRERRCRLRGGHAAPAVECRRSWRTFRGAGDSRRCRHEAPGDLADAPAHAREHRAFRPGHEERRPAHRLAAAAGLSRDAGPDGGCEAGPHRFRRRAGGDHGARRSVPHDAREHRAADHRRAGHQHARRSRRRSRAVRAWTRFLPAAASADVVRSSGTVARLRASPATWRDGWRNAAS